MSISSNIFGLSLATALLGLLLMSCDNKPTTEVEKVWTSADCADHVHDSTDWHFDECDSVLYRDFINDCQWEGDTIPSAINDFTNMGAQMRPNFRNLKSLSPKIVRIWWWINASFSGSMTELPPEIWRLPNVDYLYLDGMPNLHSVPDMTERNEKLESLRIANMPLLDSVPSGLWNAPNLDYMDISYNGIQHLPNWLPRMEMLNYLRTAGNQLVDIPENIVDMPNLKAFEFNDNLITTLPSNICSSSFELVFTNNQLCSLPDSIQSCISSKTHFEVTQTCP